MRVSRVFLRRYKSFNVSLGHYSDRRAGTVVLYRVTGYQTKSRQPGVLPALHRRQQGRWIAKHLFLRHSVEPPTPLLLAALPGETMARSHEVSET